MTFSPINNEALNIIKGGYKSYEKNSCSLGNINELLNRAVLMERINANLKTQLVTDKIYSILVNVNYKNEGVLQGISPIKSMIVTTQSNDWLISINNLNGLNKILSEYDMVRGDSTVKLHWREWLS